MLFFDPRVDFEAVFGTRVSLRSLEKYIEVSDKLAACYYWVFFYWSYKKFREWENAIILMDFELVT